MQTGSGGFVYVHGFLAKAAILAIESGKLGQAGGHEFGRIDGAGLAVRPRLQAIGREVQNVGVARQGGGRETKRQPVALGIELDVVDESGYGQTRRREILVKAQVDYVEFRRPAFIADVCKVVTVARERQFLDVPGNVVGDYGLLRREEVDVPKSFELGIAVRNQVDSLPVTGEFRPGDSHLPRSRLDFALLAGGEVDDVQISLTDRHILQDEQLAIVGRPIEGIPCGVVAGDGQVRESSGSRLDDVDV